MLFRMSEIQSKGERNCYLLLRLLHICVRSSVSFYHFIKIEVNLFSLKNFFSVAIIMEESYPEVFSGCFNAALELRSCFLGFIIGIDFEFAVIRCYVGRFIRHPCSLVAWSDFLEEFPS